MGDETVLVPVGEDGEHFRGIVRLNETAAFIVERLQNDTTEDAITDALCAEYEVSRDEARKHVAAIVSKLLEIGALA